MREFVCATGFGTLFVMTPDGPRVAHLPLVWLDEGRIAFHTARSNDIALHLDGGDALFVINGPDAYISPDWYGLPDQVPTWNYLAVELQGQVQRLERDELIAQVEALSLEQERRLAPKPVWLVDKMSDGRFEQMLGGIIGFEMRVTAMRGTAKLNQNKSLEAREAVIKELAAQGCEEMAELMRAFGK